MSKPHVTVLGAGVVGLACALELSASYDVTIVARNMPGDPLAPGWASPFAGANLAPVHQFEEGVTEQHVRMQKQCFDEFFKLADAFPESSARRTHAYEYQEKLKSCKDVWFNVLPNFRELTATELSDANCTGSGCFYTTVMLTPDVFLSWLRRRCEDAGVHFVRAEVASLRDAAALAPCDVIVNASAHGSRTLADVQDAACVPVRGQLMLFRTPCEDIHIRYGADWTDYTYVLPRGDGTAIMGGTKGFYDIDPNVRPEEAADIHRRNRLMLPKYVPPTLGEIDLVKHQVGIRPEREGGPRVEGEILPSGLRVVHTYGLTGGGYLYSFGMAKEVKKLAEGFVNSAAARL